MRLRPVEEVLVETLEDLRQEIPSECPRQINYEQTISQSRGVETDFSSAYLREDRGKRYFCFIGLGCFIFITYLFDKLVQRFQWLGILFKIMEILFCIVWVAWGVILILVIGMLFSETIADRWYDLLFGKKGS